LSSVANPHISQGLQTPPCQHLLESVERAAQKLIFARDAKAHLAFELIRVSERAAWHSSHTRPTDLHLATLRRILSKMSAELMATSDWLCMRVSPGGTS
jgi:hypothetical protein